MRRREITLRIVVAGVSSYMEGGAVVTASGATLIIGGEATGAAAADADETAADVDAAAGAATGAGTGADSLAAHPSLPRKLIKEALPDGRLAASLTAVDSTIVFVGNNGLGGVMVLLLFVPC